MRYRILCVGKVKDEFYRKEIEFLCSQICKSGSSLDIIEFPDKKIPENMKEKNRELFLEKECQTMWNKISGRNYVVALCIEGKEISTEQHKECAKQAAEQGYEDITYLIGGSLGLPDRLKKRAELRLSFSKMTFPHQLMRMVLCEEIYGLCQT